MGLFDFFKKKETDSKPVTTTETSTSKKIDLRKKVKVELSKHNIDTIKSSVELIIDCSGSMYDEYSNGTVQKTLNRLLPIALEFDDDGTLPVTQFNYKSIPNKDLTTKNLEGFTKTHLIKNVNGGTKYAPPIWDLIEKAKSGKVKFPIFAIFITDGENSDRQDTIEAIKEASKYDIFFAFVGIGNESFSFLKKLDDLQGRRFDNADFIEIKNLNRISDEELYKELLKEYLVLNKTETLKTKKITLIK